jgi:hypothetical protein
MPMIAKLAALFDRIKQNHLLSEGGFHYMTLKEKATALRSGYTDVSRLFHQLASFHESDTVSAASFSIFHQPNDIFWPPDGLG